LDFPFAPFFTDRAADFFPLGLALMGSTEKREKMRTKAMNVERVLSLRCDTGIRTTILL